MCYSPEADVIAGIVVGAIGVDAIRHADDRAAWALASVPLVLAAHQMIEAVAWWGLLGEVPAEAGGFAVTAYLVAALGVVPALVPYAVMRVETSRTRRRLMAFFAALGVLVAVVLMLGLTVYPHDAAIGGRYVAYEMTAPGGGATAVLYVAAVCTPLLVSSHRRIVLLGILNVPAVLVLGALLQAGFISLWCVWAAITSFVIALHLRSASAERHPARTVAAH